MDSISLEALSDELLAAAAVASSGRAARTIHGGHEHVLRQTVVALMSGQEMSEHDGPPEASLLVLRGRVQLSAGDDPWSGEEGDFVRIPPARHSLAAIEDAVILLTVVADQ